MSQKFNVGDTVRCIRDEGCNLHRNTSYTVVEVGRQFIYLNGPGLCAGSRNGYLANRLELWTEPTEVHSGGPYVCISVYNELKKQNEELKADLEHMRRNYSNRYIELTDLQTENNKLNTVVDVELQKIRDRLDVLEEIELLKPTPTPICVGGGGAADAPKETKGSNGSHPPTHPPEKLFPDGLEGNYVAMDLNGDWYSYANKPECDDYEDMWASYAGQYFYIEPATYTHYMRTYNRQSWESSLHEIKKAST